MKLFEITDFKGTYNIPLPESEVGVTALLNELDYYEKKAMTDIVGEHVFKKIFSYIDSNYTPVDVDLDKLLGGADYIVQGETKSFIGLGDSKASPVKDLIYSYWLIQNRGNEIGWQTTEAKENNYTDLDILLNRYNSYLLSKIGDVMLYIRLQVFSYGDNGTLYDFVQNNAELYPYFKARRFETNPVI